MWKLRGRFMLKIGRFLTLSCLQTKLWTNENEEERRFGLQFDVRKLMIIWIGLYWKGLGKFGGSGWEDV